MSAEVNGVEILDEAVEAEVRRLQPDYERYVIAHGSEPDEKQLAEWALENLIEQELLVQEAQRSQPEPGEDKVNAYLEENSAALDDTLTDQEKRALCIRDIKMRALVKSVRKNVNPPTAAEQRKEYDDKSERFTMPESLKISHICRLPRPGVEKSHAYLDLLSLKKQLDAQEIQWVEALPESDTYHDDFGMFDTVMRGMLMPEIEEKLFALNRGDVSDVIELESGTIHLFKIMVKRAAELLPFEEVQADIAAMMFNEAAENALNELIDTLKKNAEITR